MEDILDVVCGTESARITPEHFAQFNIDPTGLFTNYPGLAHLSLDNIPVQSGTGLTAEELTAGGCGLTH